MTDDNGDYTTNPILTVSLSAVAPVIEYLSVKFAGGIDTSYPKTFKIRTYNSTSLIKEYVIDISTQTGLPLLVVQIGDKNVLKVEFEFVGTICPHRRSRLDKIMFGKVEQVNNYYLQDWKIDDKASLVADSIPTKTLSYSIIDYDGDYDIDNPARNNKIPNDYKDVMILFTFSMEKDGLWKYAPTKTFNLMDISTSSDGVVTFECGSLLDILTETYDHDIYNGERTIQEVMNDLLSFSGVGIDQCELNDFSNYKINVPLPESPVRELIQKLAFSCGATLTVNDANKIIFSQKNIIPTESTPKFMFNQPKPFASAAVLLEEPKAEALANTKNIAMYSYDSTIDDEISELGSSDISTINPVKISFSATAGVAMPDLLSIQEQYAELTVLDVYSQHATVQVSWNENATLPIKVTVNGRKVTTTKTLPYTVSKDTLLLDSGLAHETDTQKFNFLIKDQCTSEDLKKRTFFYDNWYGAKFKYICKTRNEYLIKAGDIVYFETLYSNGKPDRVGYVLRNSYSDNEDSGEMEVIMIANN